MSQARGEAVRGGHGGRGHEEGDSEPGLPASFQGSTHLNLSLLTSNPLLAAGGGPVRQEAQPVRRRQDLQRCQEENLRLDATGGIISDLSFFFWFNIEMKIVVIIDMI